MNGFMSLRRLDGWLCCPRRKSIFSPKLRESKMTFSKSEEKEVAGVAWLGNQRGVGKVAVPTS